MATPSMTNSGPAPRVYGPPYFNALVMTYAVVLAVLALVSRRLCSTPVLGPLDLGWFYTVWPLTFRYAQTLGHIGAESELVRCYVISIATGSIIAATYLPVRITLELFGKSTSYTIALIKTLPVLMILGAFALAISDFKSVGGLYSISLNNPFWKNELMLTWCALGTFVCTTEFTCQVLAYLGNR